MTAIVEVENLTKHFGSVTAVDDASFAVQENSICGLLGRNGAGKTTLMQLITGQEFASSGTMRVFGESPVENAAVLSRTCFVKESQTYPEGFSGKHVLKAASWAFPEWDEALARDLVEEFDVPLNRRIKKLSRGQRSAIGVVVGIASRADLTIFDEPYAGLDAVARQAFYDRLLRDYSSHPRTVIMSTHLIDEVADLLDHVVVINAGKIVIDEESDALRGAAVTVAGVHAAVQQFTGGRDVLVWDSLGGLATATVAGLTPAEHAEATSLGLEIGAVSLQQLIIDRTRGIAREGNAS